MPTEGVEPADLKASLALNTGEQSMKRLLSGRKVAWNVEPRAGRAANIRKELRHDILLPESIYWAFQKYSDDLVRAGE